MDDSAIEPGASLLPGTRLISHRLLSRLECADLRWQLAKSTSVPSRVLQNGVRMLDQRSRRTKKLEASLEVSALVKEKLESFLPTVRDGLQLQLRSCQTPQFYRYDEGDFFGPHRDNYGRAHSPAEVLARKAAVILFLNDGRHDAEFVNHDAFEGGLLRLYDVVPGYPSWTVVPEAGTIVSFPTDVLHEVTAVTRGSRLTAVTWYV